MAGERRRAVLRQLQSGYVADAHSQCGAGGRKQVDAHGHRAERQQRKQIGEDQVERVAGRVYDAQQRRRKLKFAAVPLKHVRREREDVNDEADERKQGCNCA